MAVPVQVDLNPNTKKVEAALARIQAQAKGIDFGGGAKSIEKLSRPLGKITGQATEFQKSLEASNARVLAFGASVAVINKLSQAFGALVSNTIKVEATFAKINTILGGTQKQLEQFGNGIFSVAQKTATSFDQVAEGALELARQGLSVEESLSRVETALKLVRVAGIDSQQAVAGLTAAIKGFEGSGLTVAQIADKLAEVDTKFAVSTEDLINGLERSSASARVAGVSFDELLGVITTVQERTQRGGAVIGNAFKTIFARLGRTDTLVALDELGISILDTQGNVRGAIPLFQELAVELNKIGLKSVEAGEIIQKVAGVRQRDILISLVEDLNSGQSQFAKSLQVSAGAAGALDSKNNQLNNTLESLINNLTIGAQKLSSLIGDLGFADSAKDILKLFSSIVNGITDLLQGDSVGSKFAQGIIKGIGGVLTGPGIALIGAIFVKLFVDLAKFGASSLKSLLGINQATQQQNALQQSVLQTLLQNENIQKEILGLEGNRVAQEQLLLRIYNDQAAALARVQKAAATVTPGLFGAGLRGGERGVSPKGKASGGYIAAEARDISRGVGGAPASSKVVSIPNFAFGGGKRGTMVANTSEYIVPNFAGGGDAIFNRDMVRSMGLPAGARKINAAGGYVPNFAAPRVVEDSRFALITPSRGGGKFGVGKSKSGVSYRFPILGYNDSKIKGRETEQFTNAVSKFGVGLANLEAKKLTGGKPIAAKLSKLGNQGSISSLAGVIYEAAISAILKSPQYDLKQTATFDFVGSGARDDIAKIYPGLSESVRFIEAKIAGGTDIFNSMANKMERFGAGKKTLPRTGLRELIAARVGDKSRSSIQKEFQRAASGFVPNFAGGALEEAIGREQAAGLPINQIRINQSGKLRNAQNPMGLAVTNTRDEPTGAIPNFAARSTPANTGGSSDPFQGGILAASTGLFFLSSALSGAESGLGKFISEIAFAASALTSLTLLKGPLENVGSKLSNFGIKLATFNPRFPGKAAGAGGSLGRGIAGVGRALPAIGTAVAIGSVVAPLVLELTKTKTGFEKLNEELKNIDLGELSSGSEEASQALKSAFQADLKRSADRAQLAEKLGVSESENIEKIIEKQVEGLTGINRGVFGGVKDKETLSASLAKIGKTDDLQEIIKQSQEKVTIRGRRERKVNRFSPDLFAENMIKAIEEIDAAAEKLKEDTTKAAAEAKFGKGAKFGAVARTKIQESFTEGRFAAGGFDTQKQIAPEKPGDLGTTLIQLGALSKIRQQEFDLAKAISTEDKVRLQNQIALDKFQVEASKERFKITEDYVNSIKDGTVFREEEFEIVQGLVKEGKDLQEIENALLKLGVELSIAEKESFQLALAQLDIKNKELDNQEQEILNLNAINDLQKPQGFGEGFKKGLGQVKEDIDFFADELGEQIPTQFSNNLGAALKDAVSEAKTLDEALSDAGRNFLGFMRDAFLQQAADQFTSTIFGSLKSQGSLFGKKSGSTAPDGTPNNPIYTASSPSGTNPVDALTGEKGGEGIFAKLKRTLTDAFGFLKTTFGDLFGSLKDSLGSIFKNLTSSLGNLFSSFGGGGFGGFGGGFFSGLLGIFGFANGGSVGFGNGGPVGSTDTIPAMLTPGEFVIKKSAVDKYGSGFLSSINEGAMPMRGFQNGGVVGPVSVETGTGATSAPQINNTSDFTFNIQNGQAEQEGGQGGAENQRDFAQKIKSAVTTVIQEESRTGGSLNYLYKK